MKPLALAAALLIAAASSAAQAAAACHAVSGPTVRPLVELYTSEGCDSCPPADRWLSTRFAAPGGDAVALAFHVDYWDRLGWKDRFASAAYTARQYQAAAANHEDFVYTPQVLLQGRALRWQSQDAERAVRDAATAPAHVRIDATARREGDAIAVDAQANVDDAGGRRDAVLTLAYVDGGLVSDVKAGENRGVRLQHDRVVRALASGTPGTAQGRLEAHASFGLPAERGHQPVVVAFVQRERDGAVLQALELPLGGCATP